MTMEFFAYWNGSQIRDLFEAVVAITGSADFTGLLKTIILFGFLCVITVCALRYRGLDAGSFIFAVALFYGVTLVPKTDLAINDERSGSVYVVSNVPLGLAFMASTTSHVGHWLTDIFEDTFAGVEAERFSRFGMVFPERAVNAILAAGPVTAQGRTLISDFNRNCVMPELIDYPQKIEALSTSGNLWQTIAQTGWVNPARKTQDTASNWLGCDEAIAFIDNHMATKELPAIQKHLAMKLLPDQLDASTLILRVLPQAESLLLGVSQSLASSIKHSVFMNTLQSDIDNVAALAGHPLATATALAKAQGNLSSEINYRTMAEIAKDALPKVRNSLEFIILASFPLIFIMMLAAGHMAGTILRSYLTLLVWIQLWAPISAVMNYLIIHTDSHPMNQIIAEYGANTIYAASLIREAGASSQAIAGFLTILAPVIAFAIAKGSDFATAQLAASVMAPAQSAAQSQGASLTSGNISLGNTSWGNVSTNTQSGNKSDRSMSFTDSSMLQTASAYGSVTRNGSGTVTGMSMTPVSMGVSSAMSLGEANSQSATSSMSNSFGYSDSIQALRSYTTQTADKSMAGFTRLLNTTLNRQSGLQSANSSLDEVSSSMTSNSNQTIESNFNNGQTATIRSSVSFSSGSATNSEKTNPSIQSNLSAQNSEIKDTNNINSSVGKTTGLESIRQSLINGGNPSSLSSSVLGQLQTTQQLVDSVSQQNNASNNKQRQEAYKSLLTATRQIAESTSDSGIRNAAQNFEKQLSHAYQLGNRQSFEQSASLGASSQIGYVSNQDIRTMMDSSPTAMQKAIETFGSAEAAQNALFHSAAARRYFAQQLHQSMDHGDWNNDSPQPLSTVGIDTMARPHRESFETEKFNQFDQTRQANHLDYQISKQSSIGDKEIADLPQTSAVTNSVNNFRESMNADKTQLQDSLLTERGTTLSAKAVYEEKQSGVPTVFANAYLGGALYSSPHEYKDQLTEKANSESFRKSMQEIGKQDKAELSEVERYAQK
ncbi:conjugal transfer protein TraG N-terminal domain-containing protein [Parasutterella secunda]|uniref:conjugal transfer protein TraG N-terminal domain-containing protein n=2 Tax=Parasutterella secunda TaxID=626947 RepID=UPI0025A49165|nr:conjugal transfer protein TraG N-terminal domain-containing protein [Parasutterella secunda]MDM8112818.1 conjugal transfer protein TraG N-terminal domain-containing protein [Parasutterella secunda]MDM8217913.1 conjugal transfer protein TraG N-terminal domain-containing protein [Parasutterella secunda]